MEIIYEDEEKDVARNNLYARKHKRRIRRKRRIIIRFLLVFALLLFSFFSILAWELRSSRIQAEQRENSFALEQARTASLTLSDSSNDSPQQDQQTTDKEIDSIEREMRIIAKEFRKLIGDDPYSEFAGDWESSLYWAEEAVRICELIRDDPDRKSSLYHAQKNLGSSNERYFRHVNIEMAREMEERNRKMREMEKQMVKEKPLVIEPVIELKKVEVVPLLKEIEKPRIPLLEESEKPIIEPIEPAIELDR